MNPKAYWTMAAAVFGLAMWRPVVGFVCGLMLVIAEWLWWMNQE